MVLKSHSNVRAWFVIMRVHHSELSFAVHFCCLSYRTLNSFRAGSICLIGDLGGDRGNSDKRATQDAMNLHSGSYLG